MDTMMAVAEEIGGKSAGFSAVTGEEGQRVAAAWEKYRASGYDPEVMYQAGVWARPDEDQENDVRPTLNEGKTEC